MVRGRYSGLVLFAIQVVLGEHKPTKGLTAVVCFVESVVCGCAWAICHLSFQVAVAPRRRRILWQDATAVKPDFTGR